MRSLKLIERWEKELDTYDKQIKWWENSDTKESVKKIMVDKMFKKRGLILETIMELECSN